jgi:hypothetical protein
LYRGLHAVSFVVQLCCAAEFAAELCSLVL